MELVYTGSKEIMHEIGFLYNHGIKMAGKYPGPVYKMTADYRIRWQRGIRVVYFATVGDYVAYGHWGLKYVASASRADYTPRLAYKRLCRYERMLAKGIQVYD